MNDEDLDFDLDSSEEDKKPPVRHTRKKIQRRRRRKGLKANRDVLRRFGQRLLVVVVVLILITIIAVVAFGGKIKQSMAGATGTQWILSLLYPEKYSYSEETTDLVEYFRLNADDDVAVILGDEQIAAHGKYLDDTLYFSIDTVRDLFTKRFYVNEEEGKLLYTTSTEVTEVLTGADSRRYKKGDKVVPLDYAAARYYTDGTLYIAADYIKLYSNFSYSFFPSPNRVQLSFGGGEEHMSEVLEDTSIRYRGGIKSSILRKVAKGESVKVLEVMDNWSKVKTNDCFIGYIENVRLGDYKSVATLPITGAYDPDADFSLLPPEQRVLLGFHQFFNGDNGTELVELSKNATGMNTVSPTWYFLNDDEGHFDSQASKAYVDKAHEKGLKVWALVENLEYEIDEYALFSSSERRAALIDTLMAEAEEYGFDGINMDIELTDSELAKTGPHYIQFLRELSIRTRAAGLALSTDVPVPTESNRAFDLKEQGYVCDYVILMGYDEHYPGSPAGSVASIGFVEKGLDDMISLGVPAEKIILAVPFYTRIWRTEGNSVNSEAVGMDVAAEWAETRSLTPEWDDELCQNFTEYKKDNVTYQLWLEDRDSINAKVSIATGKGVNSVGAWKLGLESEGIWDKIDRTIPAAGQ